MSCAELLPAVPVLMALRFPYPSPMPPVLPFRDAPAFFVYRQDITLLLVRHPPHQYPASTE